MPAPCRIMPPLIAEVLFVALLGYGLYRALDLAQ